MAQLNRKQLQFCFDELLGELGWGDEVEQTGVDPLNWARDEIKSLHKQIKHLRESLELRNAVEQRRVSELAVIELLAKIRRNWLLIKSIDEVIQEINVILETEAGGERRAPLGDYRPKEKIMTNCNCGANLEYGHAEFNAGENADTLDMWYEKCAGINSYWCGYYRLFDKPPNG